MSAEEATAAEEGGLPKSKHIVCVNNRLVCRVNMLDNAQTVLLVDPTATVEDVVRLTTEKLEIPDPEETALNFSLHECLDGITISRPLPPTTAIVDVLAKWPEKEDSNPKLVYQVKLYTTSFMKMTNPVIINMMYIQSVYHVIAGMYQLSLEDTIKCGALQIQVKFGKHDPERHKAGFLTKTLLEYIPGTMITKRPPEEWEELLFAAHEELDVEDPRAEYINVCRGLDYYGCALFGVRQMFDKRLVKNLILGVCNRGILLLKPADMVATTQMTTINEHSLNDIFRWAYKPKVNFYFEVKPEDEDDENPVYTFSTSEGKAIADLLTDYAMGMLREMGLNPDGTKREKAGGETKDDDDAADATDDAEDAAAAADDDSEPLPDGWIEVADEGTGGVYFYNNVTGESKWERPTADDA